MTKVCWIDIPYLVYSHALITSVDKNKWEEEDEDSLKIVKLTPSLRVPQMKRNWIVQKKEKK